MRIRSFLFGLVTVTMLFTQLVGPWTISRFFGENIALCSSVHFYSEWSGRGPRSIEYYYDCVRDDRPTYIESPCNSNIIVVLRRCCRIVKDGSVE